MGIQKLISLKQEISYEKMDCLFGNIAFCSINFKQLILINLKQVLTINWIYKKPKIVIQRGVISHSRIMVHISYRRPVLGGVIFALAMGFTTYTFSEISGIQAWKLLTTSSSGIISLCYIIIVGSIYILVMLLHLLSVRPIKTNHLRLKYYNELLNIARIATLLIISSTIVLLILNIPFTSTKIFSYSDYFKIFYIIISVASILAGGFIALITMIYQSIRNIISDKKELEMNEEAALTAQESLEEQTSLKVFPC